MRTCRVNFGLAGTCEAMTTHHRFLPPSPATGIPLNIRIPPRTPYAGSILMWNGIQSSPSFHGPVALVVVELSTVEVPFTVVFVG